MDGFYRFTRCFLGWDWFGGAEAQHDGRRRTTKTLVMFTAFARKTAFGNALLLMLGYVSFAFSVVEFVPYGFDWLFKHSTEESGLALGKAWAHSQLCIRSLSAIHSRLVRIAHADHV